MRFKKNYFSTFGKSTGLQHDLAVCVSVSPLALLGIGNEYTRKHIRTVRDGYYADNQSFAELLLLLLLLLLL
jgi:hypothetical protein